MAGCRRESGTRTERGGGGRRAVANLPCTIFIRNEKSSNTIHVNNITIHENQSQFDYSFLQHEPVYWLSIVLQRYHIGLHANHIRTKNYLGIYVSTIQIKKELLRRNERSCISPQIKNRTASSDNLAMDQMTHTIMHLTDTIPHNIFTSARQKN